MACGVYKIVSPSGKMYIGSSVALQRRWRQHERALRRGEHHCIALQRAYDKYKCDLHFETLIICEKSMLLEYEQRCFDHFNHQELYNSSKIAGTSDPSPEFCADFGARMSALHKGKPLSVEHRAKIGAAEKGRKLSDGHCAKISVGLKGRIFSKEHKANLSASSRWRGGKNHAPSL